MKILDTKFTFGLFLLIMGWLLLLFPWIFIIGYAVYLIGAIFIWLSNKSTKTKLLVTLIPLILNFSTYTIALHQIQWYFWKFREGIKSSQCFSRFFLYIYLFMEKLDEDYWQSRYENNQIQWDIGAVSTPLKSYFDQLQNKGLKFWFLVLEMRMKQSICIHWASKTFLW